MFQHESLFGVGVLVLLLESCTSTTPACRVGADCASGVCNYDGTCAPVTGAQDASAPDAPDSSTVPTLDAGADAAAAGCVPNADGVIDGSEYRPKPGLSAIYLVARNATVSTAGTSEPSGARAWDLSTPLAGDERSTTTTLSPDGAWYAPTYPAVTFAAALTETSTNLGLFESSPNELRLHAIVSPEGGPLRTELAYAPPVPTFKFPLKVGSSWKTSSTITGLANGISNYYTETYDTAVDAYGTIKTPYGTFAVVRVVTVLTRVYGVIVTVTRMHSFVAECAGIVARITSQDNEPSTEFTNAAEVRRLSP